jgi:hypothetical protein
MDSAVQQQAAAAAGGGEPAAAAVAQLRALERALPVMTAPQTAADGELLCMYAYLCSNVLHLRGTRGALSTTN